MQLCLLSTYVYVYMWVSRKRFAISSREKRNWARHRGTRASTAVPPEGRDRRRRRRSVSGIMQSLVLSAFLREYDESKFIREAEASTPGIKGFKLERFSGERKTFLDDKSCIASRKPPFVQLHLDNFNWEKGSTCNRAK